MRMRLVFVLVLAAGGLSLSACADDMYGPYGYGGLNVGYGYDGYYGPYDYGYGPYGYNGFDPFGWYDDFYYPGVGFYVYDSYRRPHYWNGMQQRYWSGRVSNFQRQTGTNSMHPNWSGFSHRGGHRGH